MKTKLKSYGYFLGVAIVGIVIGAFLQGVRAWQEPSGAPSSANIIGAPINTSSFVQAKTGNLGVNGLAATLINTPQICLSGNCQTSWPTSTGGDNLGNHTATQSLNMNGNTITGASGVAVNIGGVNFTLKYANTSEDNYGTFVAGGSNDTCDGDGFGQYTCKVTENKTCTDVIDTAAFGTVDLNTGTGVRTVTCKRVLVLTE